MRGEQRSKSQALHDENNDWESGRTVENEKSKKVAWIIAGIAVGIAALQGVGIALMLPLKTVVPYVVRVDNATGVPDIVTVMTDKKVTGEDVMDKYWLAQFVIARETYQWNVLQSDYDKVGLLSSPTVGAAYAALFAGNDSLEKTYGKSVEATVKILSVIPSGNGSGTVRYVKTTKRVDQDASQAVVERFVATIGYEYRGASRMKESERLINPNGFQVLSWRADPEMGISR
ncbi:VirB8 family type IV secretion system protein [Pseudomonas sp. LB3P58]